jgi:hypothetical protein
MVSLIHSGYITTSKILGDAIPEFPNGRKVERRVSKCQIIKIG